MVSLGVLSTNTTGEHAISGPVLPSRDEPPEPWTTGSGQGCGYARTLSKAVEHARGCVAINIGRLDMMIVFVDVFIYPYE